MICATWSLTKFAISGAGHDYGVPQEKHMLEEENDKMVDALSSKVQALKSVSCNNLHGVFLLPHVFSPCSYHECIYKLYHLSFSISLTSWL